MKTITEISSFKLKAYFDIKGEVIKTVRPEFEKQLTEPVENQIKAPSEEKEEDADTVDEKEKTKASSDEKKEIAKAEDEKTEPKVEAASEENEEDVKESDSLESKKKEIQTKTNHAKNKKPEKNKKNNSNNRSSKQEAFNKKREEHRKKIELRKKVNQNPEYKEKLNTELERALAEKAKLEGDKLKTAIFALEVVDPRRIEDLRRVVVYQKDKENEKIPPNCIAKEDQFYLAEYLPSLKKPEVKRGDKFGKKRFGRGKKRGSDGGRFNKKRQPSGDRTQSTKKDSPSRAAAR